MEFEFVPFVGALPLKFGMTSAEVEKIIGPADRSMDFPIDDMVQESRSSKKHPGMPFKVFYDKHGKMAEMEFERGTVLEFKGVNLFGQKKLFDFLSKEDEPIETSGTFVFPKLGISTSKLKNDPKTIAVAREDRIEAVMASQAELKALRAKLTENNSNEK